MINSVGGKEGLGFPSSSMDIVVSNVFKSSHSSGVASVTVTSCGQGIMGGRGGAGILWRWWNALGLYNWCCFGGGGGCGMMRRATAMGHGGG